MDSFNHRKDPPPPAAGREGPSAESPPTRPELRVLRQWASTLDAIPDLIVIADLDGVVTRVNRAVADRLGMSFKEIIGRPMSGLFGDLPVPAPMAGGLTRISEVTLPFAEGRFQMSCFPNFDPDGQRIGVIHVFRDITEEKRVQERLLEAEKLATVSAVLSGVAHEMNNPLAGVLGFAQLAQELCSDPAVTECLTTVQAEADRVSRIVRNLLAFARRSQPTHRPVPWSDVVDRTRDLLAYEMRLARVTLATEVPDDLPPVLGDLQQLEQVLVSILLLAIRDSMRRKEGQDVCVRARRGVGGRVRVEVETEGPTLTQDQVAHLLDLTGVAGAEVPPGEVRLALARGFVSQHGGRIGVSSRPGGGLAFALELPAAEAVEDAEEASREDVVLDASGMRALVADDDEVTARLIANVLRMAGAHVDVVDDGKTAWARLRERRYDLLVTDFRMPGMDARDLLARLAAEGRREARRAVLVSGDTLNRETEAYVEASGLPFVAKPFTLAAVRRAIRKALAAPIGRDPAV